MRLNLERLSLEKVFNRVTILIVVRMLIGEQQCVSAN